MSRKVAAESASDERHYPSRPVVGIGVVIWREDKVLLVKRKNPPNQGQWSLPGGMQHLGETIMHAAVREALEETGLEVTPLGIVTALDAVTKDDAGKIAFHFTIIETVAESVEGTAQAQDDAAEVMWATIEEVKQLCEWPEVARVVQLSALQRVL